MSKFEYEAYRGGYDIFAVNAEKYTEQEAIEIFKKEMMLETSTVGRGDEDYIISNAYTKWRAGWDNEDNEPLVCWWLEYFKRPKGSCRVYVFHTKRQDEHLTKNCW